MRFLIYGGNGWTGNQIQPLLLKMGHEVFISNIHIEQSTQNSEIIDEIQKFNVDRLICTLGRTSGATKNNIDYLEDKNVLNARIRMPIVKDSNPRNFITKILSYSNVINVPNSMTVLPELLPILVDMSINKCTGTINLTNEGTMSASEMLKIFYPDHKFTEISLDELSKEIVGKRSNNELSTKKLSEMYTVLPLKESLDNLFSNKEFILNKK